MHIYNNGVQSESNQTLPMQQTIPPTPHNNQFKQEPAKKSIISLGKAYKAVPGGIIGDLKDSSDYS